MRRAIPYAVVAFMLFVISLAFAGDNYSVSSGNQATTVKSQGGQTPAQKPVAKPSPTAASKPGPTISPKPASTQPAQTKTIMAPTWPVQVPVRVPANTPERPDNPHAGENAGAASGVGG